MEDYTNPRPDSRLHQQPYSGTCLSFLDFFVFIALLLFALGSFPAVGYLWHRRCRAVDRGQAHA